jgi:DNA-binding XRE family transcriptional regulator
LPALRAPMQLRNREDFARLMRLKQHNDRTLAAAADLSHTTIYRLRHGDRDYTHLDTATAIADALGVTVEALFRPLRQDGPYEFANQGG